MWGETPGFLREKIDTGCRLQSRRRTQDINRHNLYNVRNKGLPVIGPTV